MTAPTQAMVERVARAIVSDIDNLATDGYMPFDYPERAASRIAHAALAACRAEEMHELLTLIATYPDANVISDAHYVVRQHARALLAEQDGTAPGGAAQPMPPATDQPDDLTELDGILCKANGHERRIADYEEVLADHRRLVRELDVSLNGDGAAQQASLCDILAQVKATKRESRYRDSDIGRQPIETAPKGVPVIVAGGVAMQKTGGEWFTGMEEPLYQRPLQWEPTWWMPIPTDNTRRGLDV